MLRCLRLIVRSHCRPVALAKLLAHSNRSSSSSSSITGRNTTLTLLRAPGHDFEVSQPALCLCPPARVPLPGTAPPLIAAVELLAIPDVCVQAYLLGTAHVSERSERTVRQVVAAGAIAACCR